MDTALVGEDESEIDVEIVTASERDLRAARGGDEPNRRGVPRRVAGRGRIRTRPRDRNRVARPPRLKDGAFWNS